MSTSIGIKGVSDNSSPEFKKHFNAVHFCIENDLSFPKETSEFFRGRIQGDDLEDYRRDCLIERIEDGLEINLISAIKKEDFRFVIDVSKIPSEVSKIIVFYS